MTRWSRFWYGVRRGIGFRRPGSGFLAAGALILALALTLALFVGLTVDHPGNALAASGASFPSCPTGPSAENTFQGYLDTGGTIQYTGATPCTITLTSALTIGSSASITIDGGVGLTLDQTTSNDDVIDITDSTANRSTLALDQVTVEGGYVGIFDGMRAATVALTQSTVRDNGHTGIEAGNVSLTQSTVSDNGNGNPGGDGIYASGGSVTLTQSTVSDNGNGNGGDGGYGIDAPGGKISLTNSTVSDNGNSTLGPGGFGIQGSTITLADSTLSANASGGGGAGINATSGLSLTASILANPGATNCQGPHVTDHGYNLATDSSCGLSVAGSESNVTNLNLQPLANNGGPTETMALGPGSSAIDAIPVFNGQCSLSATSLEEITYPGTTTSINTDQRGVTRPQGPACDIGAYEVIQGAYTQAESTCPTQAELQDDLNLGGQTNGQLLTINLPPNCTIDLTSALEVGDGVNITIDGNGLTLVGNGTATTGATFDDIDVADATNSIILTLNQVTLERGEDGIGYAGGMDMVTLNNSTVSGNTYDGIDAADATVTDSTISGNGSYGAGTDNATVTDSTVSGNGNVGVGAFNATVTASILADNNSQSCSTPNLTDGGYNLSTDDSCGFTATGSQNNVPSTGSGGLNLLLLGNYGGPTETIALGPGSSAIDQIPAGTTVSINNQSVTLCPSTADGSVTDQRGIDRPQGAKCDVGAYEAPAVTLTTTPSSPASSGWYNATTLANTGDKLAISVSFSGLATGELPSCSGATVSGLPASAVAGLNQGASGMASLGDGTYTISCGVKQGTTVLGVSQNVAQPLTLKIDTTPPVITSPVANGQYLANQPVTLGCADPNAADGATGSGIQTCAVTVKEPNGTTTTVQSGTDVPTGQTGSYTVTPNTVTDVAGNADTTSFTYTVTYGLVALPGNTSTVNHGYFALIRFAPEDVNGVDEASRTLKVTSVELDGPGGQVIPFVHQFQYGTFNGKPGYQLALNTRSLSPGTWILKVQVGSTQMTYSISFEVE